MDARIPVTLITGFLGSGKTTLVNRLLRQDPDRFYVVVNEYGEVPLDDRLVEGRVEAIAEGCLCCGLGEELVATLHALADREAFAHLLLETSGLAHPGPVLQALLSPLLRRTYRLAGVVTLVDPLHVDLYAHFPEARAQVVYADLLLLTKADLAEAEELTRAEDLLRRINPLAPIRRAVRGEGPEGEEVLFPRRAPGFRLLPQPLPQHAHEEGFTGVALVREGALALEEFKGFMEDLVLARGPFRESQLVRAKGEVHLLGASHALRFHGVYGLFDFEKGPPWPPGPRLNRLVFIGKNLDRERIAEAFSRILKA